MKVAFVRHVKVERACTNHSSLLRCYEYYLNTLDQNKNSLDVYKQANHAHLTFAFAALWELCLIVFYSLRTEARADNAWSFVGTFLQARPSNSKQIAGQIRNPTCHSPSSFICEFLNIGKGKDIKWSLRLSLQDFLNVLCNKNNNIL